MPGLGFSYVSGYIWDTFLSLFCGQISLCSRGLPRTYHVTQAGFKLGVSLLAFLSVCMEYKHEYLTYSNTVDAEFNHLVKTFVIVKTGPYYVCLAGLELAIWTRLAPNSQSSIYPPLPPVLGLKACGTTLNHRHYFLILSQSSIRCITGSLPMWQVTQFPESSFSQGRSWKFDRICRVKSREESPAYIHPSGKNGDLPFSL